jgi:secondary thiamine-phosphate synthase enzyme
VAPAEQKGGEVKEFTVRTSRHSEFVEITAQVQQAVNDSGVRDGVCTVFVPHTTAGITINENADPAVMEDIEAALERLVPWAGSYRHNEGNAAAHVKSSLLGHSVQVPVRGGKLQFGTWQGIFLCEFDGPRTRKVWVTVSG